MQTRRQIGRVADHGLFLRRSRSDEIADHDDAGRYADADLQRLTGGSFELPGDRRDFQRRPDRPFGVFFMGAREAEIGENAVAHEFRDKPVVARHRARTGVLVAADDIAHVLGIEPRRQRGRADEIAEHHGELPALGGALGRGWARRAGRRRTGESAGGHGCDGEPRHRRQHLAAMTQNGDAEFLQVFGRQRRQDLAVDLVLAKGVLILSEAETSQPIPDVHDRSPIGCGRS